MNTQTTVEKALDVAELNKQFSGLPFRERLEKLYEYFDPDEILYTSSFGTKSVFLLHLIHQINPQQRVHFIDTTYHFVETLEYKSTLEELLDLDIITIKPPKAENQLTNDGEWWNEHPKMCCTINKIVPLEPFITGHKVWISGLMGYQTSFRAHLRVWEQQGDIKKFHPILDIDEGEFLYHMALHKLPRHPLEKYGYGSIGCTHCTQAGEGRSGRWTGKNKTECGLHPNFFYKK